jgi:hypothetical protein
LYPQLHLCPSFMSTNSLSSGLLPRCSACPLLGSKHHEGRGFVCLTQWYVPSSFLPFPFPNLWSIPLSIISIYFLLSYCTQADQAKVTMNLSGYWSHISCWNSCNTLYPYTFSSQNHVFKKNIVLEFELRFLCLLGKFSTSWLMPPPFLL